MGYLPSTSGNYFAGTDARNNAAAPSGGGGNRWWTGNLGALTAPQDPATIKQNNQNFVNNQDPFLNSGMPTLPAITQPTFSPDSSNYPTYLKNLGEQSAQENFQRSLNNGAASPQTLFHAQDELNANRLNYFGQAGQAQLGVDKAKNDYLDQWNSLLTQIYGIQAGMRGQNLQFLNNRVNGGGGGGGGGRVTVIGGNRNALGGSNANNYYAGAAPFGSPQGAMPMQSGEASGPLDPGYTGSFVANGFSNGGWSTAQGG